ncbi:hypothetical protein BsWGS_14195 [Bradybaena similaris]
MPPPLKNAITNEHEELLWNNRLLSTDNSIGLIQAVIFYLIKCFGLWQGRDLKLLKTEHVTFGEDEIGKFVAIDIRKALGSGRVIKRYDDHCNPRSVYKIMKTYKGYLANEGPFLVRPITSIKDYICYSPWPVGLTILEQSVVNIMQDCGIGPGFGNVSVCLMSIDILKSFGTGGHCISTWFSRLYPKYKKSFWAEAFRECSDMNCEDKNQEACLMISHLLDPPYPATKMLSEMKRHQELQDKVGAVNAQRSSLFTSWISNINSTEIAEVANATDTGSQKSKANKRKTTGKEKPHSRIKEVQCNLRQNVSGNDTSPKLSAVPPSTSSLQVLSNITVKTEILTDCESCEADVNSSDMKIMAVLSIPESAFSAQVDEAECTADGTDEDMTPTEQRSERRDIDKTCTDHLNNTSSCFKRKFSHLKNDDVDSCLGVKHTKVCKLETDESEAGENDLPPYASQIGKAADIESDCDIVSLHAEVKEELEIEDDSSIDRVSNDSDTNTESSVDKLTVNANRESYSTGSSGNKLTVSANRESYSTESSGNKLTVCANRESYSTEPQDTDDIKTRHQLHSCPGQSSMHVCPSSSEVGKPYVDIDHFLSTGLDSELPVEHDLKTCVCTSKTSPLEAESLLLSPSLPNSSLSTSVLKPALATTLSNSTKDSIKILRNLFHQEGKTDHEDKTTHGEISECSSSSKILWERACADTCSSPIQEAEAARQKVSDTSQIERVGSECHSVNKSSASNSPRNPNHCASSARSNWQLSANAIPNASTAKNSTCLSNSQTGTDIVKFLDAANQQLENILQVSSFNTSLGNKTSWPSSAAATHSDNLIAEHSSELLDQPYKLKINNSGQSLLKLLPSRPRCESSSRADSPLSSINLGHCQSPQRVSAAGVSEKPETPNVYVSNTNAPSPLLSVLEEPASSRTLARGSNVEAHVQGHALNTRSVLKKKSTRLKAPLLKRAQKLNRCCCRCRNRPYHRPKNDPPFRAISHHKQTYKNDKLSSCHKLVEINSTDNCNTSVSSNLYSLDSGTFPNPSSLLAKATIDSSSDSGFYYYSSDHQENVVYQTVGINKGNKRSQTFTISDLPLGSNSRCQGDSSNSSTSEICLGDYFPAGTVLPVKDVKLLTRQCSTGLEVVLKFEYRVSRHDAETAGQLDTNK